MRIYTLNPKDDWVIGTLAEEWTSMNKDIIADTVEQADIVWLLPGWLWSLVPSEKLKGKIVVTTVNHICPTKITDELVREIRERDKITDVYHVTSEITKSTLAQWTTKPIHVFSYWLNQETWRPLHNKDELRQKHRLPIGKKLVGSFQKDTEGTGKTRRPKPKLPKGPDLLCDYLESQKDVEVVLTGYHCKRQYVRRRLEQSRIRYHYFEKIKDLHQINELLNCLDLYVVTARTEGGPRAIVECAAAMVPIISTPVGIASEFLHPESVRLAQEIGQAIPHPDYAYEKVRKIMLPHGFDPFRRLFAQLFLEK